MTDWREQGTCRADPDAWFDSKFRTAAVHICRAHCPVVEQCNAWAQTAVVCGGVAGGIAFGDNGELLLRNGLGQSARICTPECRPYRQSTRDRQEE